MDTKTVTINSDHAKFVGTLFKEHRKKVFSFLYFRVKGDKDLANDLMSEVFSKLLVAVSSGKYKPQGKDLPWIMQISYNLLMDHFRKGNKMKMFGKSSEFKLVNLADDPPLSWEDKQRNLEIGEDLLRVLEMLPKEQREVVIMRIYLNMPFREIAETLNLSINTAIGRMRYALINLRKLVKARNLDISDFKT